MAVLSKYPLISIDSDRLPADASAGRFHVPIRVSSPWRSESALLQAPPPHYADPVKADDRLDRLLPCKQPSPENRPPGRYGNCQNFSISKFNGMAGRPAWYPLDVPYPMAFGGFPIS